MNQPTFLSAVRILPCLAVLTLVIAWSCDSYETDMTPDDRVSVEQTEFYALSNSSTVIDLKTLVKSDARVDLLIGKQPSQGSLTKLGGGLYAYMPQINLESGRDYFMLDVRRDGQTIQLDTIHIKIGQDTTQLPCGVYALADYISIPNPTAGQVIPIDVLANDHICGADTSDLVVSVFSAPQHGSATSNGTNISYTTSGFTGHDAFLYMVRSLADTSVHTIGLVNVALADTCIVVARPDTVNVSSGAQGFGVNIFVLDNDTYCDSIQSLTVTIVPKAGTATVQQPGNTIFYKPNNNTYAAVDSLRYMVCRNPGGCSSAWVVVNSH